MSDNQNMNGALCYAFGWVTGLIFLLIEKQNKFVRFHAAQSLITFGALSLLTLVLPFAFIVDIILWIFLMYQAYQGKEYHLPVIGDFADKLAGNVSSGSSTTPPTPAAK
jgi:uncharacterized membrane protein